MLGVLKGLSTTLQSFMRRPVTVQYPDEKLPLAPRFMGFPDLLYDDAVDEPKCVGCGVCALNCPTDCITVTIEDNPKYKEGKSPRKKIVGSFEIDVSRCIQCNICVEVCPFDAIEMSHTYELASETRVNLVDEAKMLEMSRAKSRELQSREDITAEASPAAEKTGGDEAMWKKGAPNTIEKPKTIEMEKETPRCHHYWVIGVPAGPTSKGRCKLCGEEREFKNSTEDYLLESDDIKDLFHSDRLVGIGGRKPSFDDE